VYWLWFLCGNMPEISVFMLTLKAKIRKDLGKKVKALRKQGILPAVLYGPETKNLTIEIDFKEFENVYKEAGESSLILLQVDNDKFSVLIHEVKKDPLTGKPIHADFYQPILTEEVEATVLIVFEGEALAIKELGGTLVREISEIEVKALPKDLPHEIKVNISGLKTFDDEILVKDLKLPQGVIVQRDKNEIVALVIAPETEKIEEELEKPIEEKVEEVEEAEEKEDKEEKEKPEEKKDEEKKDEK